MRKDYTDPTAGIPPTEAAIVTTSNMTELELVLPAMKDDEELPEAALFLVACAMRYHADPRFVQAQLRWLAEHQASKEERMR